MQSLQFIHEVIGREISGGSHDWWKEISIIVHEQYVVVGQSMHHIVVCKHSQRQHGSLVILLVVYIAPQVWHCVFYLTNGLGMMYG